MMSETVVTMDGSSNNASNNQRQVPTVKTEPGQPNPLASIRLNAAYFKTIPGILKLAQLNWKNKATMSHSVTIRTQTMTTSSSMIVINTGYLKSWNGILKFLQLALGIVCVGIIGNEFNTYLRFAPQCFFLVITVTFMISTFILLLSCLMSLSTASIISKTIYELLYHSIALGLLFAASLTLLIYITNYKRYYNYELLLGGSICGLINTCLYLFSTILAFRTYKGF